VVPRWFCSPYERHGRQVCRESCREVCSTGLIGVDRSRIIAILQVHDHVGTHHCQIRSGIIRKEGRRERRKRVLDDGRGCLGDDQVLAGLFEHGKSCVHGSGAPDVLLDVGGGEYHMGMRVTPGPRPYGSVVGRRFTQMVRSGHRMGALLKYLPS
jgi:hypothetical protein